MQVPSSGLLQRIVFHSDPQRDLSFFRWFMLLVIVPVIFLPGIRFIVLFIILFIFIVLFIFNGINGS